MLIFTRTRVTANQVAEHLDAEGMHADVLHAEKTQRARQDTLDQFRSGVFPYLVATDIAARGIDVTSISHVINFDLPPKADDYLHRIGRTGRMERAGHAISLMTRADIRAVREIERMLGKKIEVAQLEGCDHQEMSNPAPVPMPTATPYNAIVRSPKHHIAAPHAPKRPFKPLEGSDQQEPRDTMPAVHDDVARPPKHQVAPHATYRPAKARQQVEEERPRRTPRRAAPNEPAPAQRADRPERARRDDAPPRSERPRRTFQADAPPAAPARAERPEKRRFAAAPPGAERPQRKRYTDAPPSRNERPNKPFVNDSPSGRQQGPERADRWRRDGEAPSASNRRERSADERFTEARFRNAAPAASRRDTVHRHGGSLQISPETRRGKTPTRRGRLRCPPAWQRRAGATIRLRTHFS